MTKQIPLTQGKVALVDDDVYDFLGQWKWYAGRVGRTWRAIRIANRKHVAMHRVIMDAPEGMDVDHVNGNGLDNRRANLRVCTHAENMFNLPVRSDSSTGIKGVYAAPRKRSVRYRSHIQVHGKLIYLGTFTSIEAAKEAYDEAALKYHGVFSGTNREGQHGK